MYVNAKDYGAASLADVCPQSRTRIVLMRRACEFPDKSDELLSHLWCPVMGQVWTLLVRDQHTFVGFRQHPSRGARIPKPPILDIVGTYNLCKLLMWRPRSQALRPGTSDNEYLLHRIKDKALSSAHPPWWAVSPKRSNRLRAPADLDHTRHTPTACRRHGRKPCPSPQCPD